jgi:hypothetical protein
VSISSTPLFGIDAVEYYPQDEFTRALDNLRSKLGYRGKLNFSKIGGTKWSKGDLAHLSAINLAVDALSKKRQDSFKLPLHCKLAVMLYPSHAPRSLYGGQSRKEREMRYDETILRILLKGAAHFLYDENNRVEIVSIVADGQPGHRTMDRDRIITQLTVDELSGRTPLRDYVSFAATSTIQHLSSDHRSHPPNSIAHKYANMLQIADLLLGSTLRACYVGMTFRKRVPRIGDACCKKDVVAQPVKEMFDKRDRGSGFRNSGHFRSFTVSWIDFSAQGVSFRELQTKQIQFRDQAQLQLQMPRDDDA